MLKDGTTQDFSTQDDSTTTAVLDQIAPDRKTRFISRWKKLVNEQNGLDYEVGILANEVREEFPDGASGNRQFRDWVVEHFGITGSRARKLLEAAKGVRLFPDKAIWVKVGGWQTIVTLLGFKPSARAKLLKATIKRADELKRNLCGHSITRRLAYDLNVQSDRTVGRPTRTNTEEALAVLREFIVTLYESFNNLPPIPDKVKFCLKSSKLHKIAKQAKG